MNANLGEKVMLPLPAFVLILTSFSAMLDSVCFTEFQIGQNVRQTFISMMFQIILLSFITSLADAQDCKKKLEEKKKQFFLFSYF